MPNPSAPGPHAPAAPPLPAAGTRASMSSIDSRRCPVCGGRFPADFRVCPRDAVPLEDAPEGGEVYLELFRLDRNKPRRIPLTDGGNEPPFGSPERDRAVRQLIEAQQSSVPSTGGAP